jgi:hypothetical protein
VPDHARLDEVAAQQHGVISSAQAAALGLSKGAIDWKRESGVWRPLLAGVYLVDGGAYPATWGDLPFAVRLAAARLFHGRLAVAVLDTAAQVNGLLVDQTRHGTIHITLPPGRERHQQAGVRVHTWKLAPGDTTLVEGTAVTSVIRTVADLLLVRDRLSAVGLLDGAMNSRRLRPHDLRQIAELLSGRRGAVEARRRLAECNELAASPLETRVRLIAKDAGLAPHHLQYPVRDSAGVLLGYGDMAWDRAGRGPLVAEADGKGPHGRPEALYRDRRRANDFVAAGVDVVRFTWEDTLRPAYVVSVLRRHLGTR